MKKLHPISHHKIPNLLKIQNLVNQKVKDNEIQMEVESLKFIWSVKGHELISYGLRSGICKVYESVYKDDMYRIKDSLDNLPPEKL